MSHATVDGVPWHAVLADVLGHPVPQERFHSGLEGFAQGVGTELLLSGSKPRQKGAHLTDIDDPMVAYLAKKGLVLGEGRNGEVYVECPWKHEHTSDSGITESVWFAAGTNGYERGNYRCLHAHCDGRGASEFELAVGYIAEDFAVLPPLDVEGEGAAIEGEPSGGGVQVFERDDICLVAQAAQRKLWRKGQDKTLLRSQGLWYEYTGTHYEEVSEEEVRADLWRYLKTVFTFDKKGNMVPMKPTRDYVGNVSDALKAEVGVKRAVAPCWLGGSIGPDPKVLLPMTDGILDVTRRVLLPHNPRLFVTNALTFGWGSDAVGPPREWLKFMRSVWGDDEEAILTLQEIMGYLLTPDTSQQKMFLLIGPRRSGKGTIGRVLTALLGAHNCCAPTMASFAGEFGAAQIIGKLAAIFPDARSGGLGMNAQAVVERLLQISGEDHMEINRKNKEFWSGRPTARVLIMANEPPKLGDASGALPGRFITLSMYKSFYGQEDHGLEARLMAELPAILRWALDGRDRLMRRGYFIQPESGKDDLDDMQAMGNPVGQFVEACCDLDAESTEPTDLLFEAWRDWCAGSGHHAGAKETFGRSLRVAFPNVHKVRPRGEDGRQYAAYAGIKLRDAIRKTLLVGGL